MLWNLEDVQLAILLGGLAFVGGIACPVIILQNVERLGLGVLALQAWGNHVLVQILRFCAAPLLVDGMPHQNLPIANPPCFQNSSRSCRLLEFWTGLHVALAQGFTLCPVDPARVAHRQELPAPGSC